MPGISYQGILPPLSSEEQLLAERLRRHVEILANEIGERHLWRYDALQQTAAYIRQTFRELGYNVETQSFLSLGKTVENIIAVLPGTIQPSEIIVVGAHYDSVWGSPAANDNGSGVAALLELARLLAAQKFTRALHWLAFVNEEAPFFSSVEMGSRVYAQRAKQRSELIAAMLSLETVGYYTDAPDSQTYPLSFLRLFYPSAGNFIGFVGNTHSRALVRECVANFRRAVAFPAEGIAAPAWVPAIDLSDHRSFWEQGYPALMVTDTAPFRYPYYHTAEDTPDKINYEHLARVVWGLSKTIETLAVSTTLSIWQRGW